MVLPFVAMKMGTKVGKWAGKKVMNKAQEKFGDKLSDGLRHRAGTGLSSLTDKLPGSLREKMTGLNMPGMRGGSSDPHETTPYLGKWDNLSQVWVNRWTILLFLVMARVLLAVGGVDNDIVDAREKVVKACLKLEEVGTAMASMPHYMSSGVNDMTASGIEGAVNGVVKVTVMLISGVEYLIIFIIGLWKSTWTCLISALIQGAFDMAEQVVKGAADIAKEATSGIADLLEGTGGVLNDFIKAINKIPFVPDAPKVNIDEAVDKLKNLNIDVSEAVKGINGVQDKIPTYDEIEAKTAETISIPFAKLKKLINDNWGNFTFDRKVLPVAEKNEIQICSNNPRLGDFFQELADTVNKWRGIFIGLCVVGAFLAIAWFAWLEIRKWNRAEETINMAQERAYDLFDATWIANNPYLAKFAFWLGEKISDDPDKQLLVRWTIAYATSPVALFVLALAMAGLLTCLLQFILLQVVKHEIPKLVAEISGLAAGVVRSLEATSTEWAYSTNNVIRGFETDINKDMFGGIKEATKAVNDALSFFTKGVTDGLNTAFGGTPFMNPLKTVVDCVLLDKIEKVQSGLTWVEKNANLSLPTLSNDTFSIANLAGNGDGREFLENPEQASQNEIGGSIDRIVDRLVKGIIQEALISTVLLLIYILLVIMGVGRAFYGAKKGINVGAGNYGSDTSSNRHDSFMDPNHPNEPNYSANYPNFPPQYANQQPQYGPDGQPIHGGAQPGGGYRRNGDDSDDDNVSDMEDDDVDGRRYMQHKHQHEQQFAGPNRQYTGQSDALYMPSPLSRHGTTETDDFDEKGRFYRHGDDPRDNATADPFKDPPYPRQPARTYHAPTVEPGSPDRF